MRWRWSAWLVLVTAWGCSPASAPSASSSEETASTDTSSGDDADSDSGDESGDTGWSSPDLPQSCDPKAQDCPVGWKCNPYSLEENVDFIGNGCFEIVNDPVGLYSDCAYLGAPYAGHDNCRLGEVCWALDEDGVGFCMGLCQKLDGEDHCADPTAICWDYGGFAPCRPGCDPLGDPGAECPRDWLGCAAFGVPNRFACHITAGANFGEPCTAAWSCEFGLVCMSGDAFAECDIETCCAGMCDVGDVDPCDAFDASQICVAWFEQPGDAPPGLENLGVCVLP